MYIYFNECCNMLNLILVKYLTRPFCRHLFLDVGPGLGIHGVFWLHQEKASKSHQDGFGSLDT